MTDLVAPVVRAHLRRAGGDRPLRQHLRPRRSQLEPHRARHVPVDPPRRATGPAQRRHVPPRLPARRRRRRARTSRSSTRPRRIPGRAYNFSDESPASVLEIYEACCVAAGVPGLEPKILDQAVGEIKDQYLDSSLRTVGAAAGGPRWASPTVWPGRSPGTRTCSDRRDDRASRSCAREILELTREYYDVAFPEKPFVGGISQIPVSGKVFDADEMSNLVDASLDFWLTTGRYAEEFEKRFAKVMGVRHALLCNSGSSANLLAVSALTSPAPRRAALRRGRRGDHRRRRVPDDGEPDLPEPPRRRCSSTSSSAPTTRTWTRSAKPSGPKTRAIMMAHTLGNPFDLGAVMEIAERARPLARRGHAATRSARPTTASRSGRSATSRP